MAATKGIYLKVKQGVIPIAGITATKISYKGDPIDITSNDDGGYQASLPECGVRGLSISGDGIAKNTIFRDLKLQESIHLLTDITITYPDGGVVSGDFFLSSYEESADTNDVIKFSYELMSSGAWTYVPRILS